MKKIIFFICYFVPVQSESEMANVQIGFDAIGKKNKEIDPSKPSYWQGVLILFPLNSRIDYKLKQTNPIYSTTSQ
jgi:hypothetical protein